MAIHDGLCMKPQDPRPMITTSFCVYPKEHAGEHSWADVAAVRSERLHGEFRDALRRIDAAKS